MTRIAVAGATGAVGKHVVATARLAGHEIVPISRSAGVDLVTGRRLAATLEGVDAVIDVTSIGTLSAKASVKFFETVTRNLLEAEKIAGVRHHVALSIVGAAQATSGYYAGKAAQERMLMTSNEDNWTILRATQFHEFAAQMVQRGAMLGMIVVPKMHSQPVAASEVGAELVTLAEGRPRRLAQDLAGPRPAWMADMVRRYLRETRQKGRVLQLRLPGSMGKISADGTLLAGPDAKLGTQTFDQWLQNAGRP